MQSWVRGGPLGSGAKQRMGQIQELFSGRSEEKQNLQKKTDNCILWFLPELSNKEWVYSLQITVSEASKTASDKTGLFMFQNIFLTWIFI